jgi:hypothetical protein
MRPYPCGEANLATSVRASRADWQPFGRQTRRAAEKAASLVSRVASRIQFESAFLIAWALIGRDEPKKEIRPSGASPHVRAAERRTSHRRRLPTRCWCSRRSGRRRNKLARPEWISGPVENGKCPHLCCFKHGLSVAAGIDRSRFPNRIPAAPIARARSRVDRIAEFVDEPLNGVLEVDFSRPFPGRDALRVQARSARTAGLSCSCE